jgi:hypothetical protein
MSQSYTYTPNPIPSNTPFSVTFNDNTESIDLSSNYNLTTTNSTVLGSFQPTSTFVSSGLNAPFGLACDSLGNLYCSNTGNNTISKITPDGTVTTFVSSGLSSPTYLACDSSGNLYCSNFGLDVISKITPNGTVSTFASGTRIQGPTGLAFDGSGNLYSGNARKIPSGGLSYGISKTTPSGITTVYTSSTTLYSPTTSTGDGSIGSLAISGDNLYIYNILPVRNFQVNAGSLVRARIPTVSGTGIVGGTTTLNGYLGNLISFLTGMVCNSNGDLYCFYETRNLYKVQINGPSLSYIGKSTIYYTGNSWTDGETGCLTLDTFGNFYGAVKNVSSSPNSIIRFATKQLVFTNVPSTNLISGVNTLNVFNGATQFNTSPILVTLLSGNTPCFKSGTKILTIRGYQPIESLRKGDMIETYNRGFVPIVMIGYSTIYNPGDSKRIKHCLYKCTVNEYPELTEDLIITGCHSILVDKFTSEEQKERTMEIWNGEILITDYKYRLPACVDTRAKPYEIEGTFTIYHIALSNEDYYSNYGIYANGLLVETTSKRYLKELSNMKLIE